MNASKKRSGFAGDVLKLVSGTTVAQLLTLLVAPILTRLFEPDTWGVLAIFVSITGILGVIACLRYELAIMLPEKDEESANLLGVSLSFSILISLLTVPIIWFGKDPILRWLNAPGLAPYLWLVPIAVFLQGVFLALNYWNSRTRHFGRLSIARVISSFSTSLGKLGFGFAGYTTAGTMIGATVAGSAIATTVLGGQIWRDDRKIFLKSIRWRRMNEGIIRHKKFPLFDSWAALMNTISTQLPPLLLAFFFSSTIVGFYALGHRLLSMPMGLIGGAIAQVFFQRASVARREGNLAEVVRTTVTRLMLFGAFPLLLVMIIGSDLFSVVFGEQWAEAGIYAQILAPWILFVFFGSPVSALFLVLEKQRTHLVFNVLLLGTRFASLLIGGFAGSILLSLGLYAGSGTILWIGLCLYLVSKAGLSIRALSGYALKVLTMSMIVLLPVILVKTYFIQPMLVVISGCLATLFYYAIVYYHDESIGELVHGYVKKFFKNI